MRAYEVVGVVGAIRGPLSEGDSYAFAYLPWPQESRSDLILIGRGRGTDQQILTSLRDVAKQADADIGVLQTRMMSRLFDDSRYPRRLAAKLLGFCALGGLILAASGLCGVLSYAVAQRRRELGIRVALGARHRDLVLLVVKEGAAVAGIGSIIGIPLAWIALRIASHYLLPMPALDVLTLGIAPLAVSVVALAGCYFPARRAARVDPIAVLRAL
jgi:putative ABC transport system permease protein